MGHSSVELFDCVTQVTYLAEGFFGGFFLLFGGEGEIQQDTTETFSWAYLGFVVLSFECRPVRNGLCCTVAYWYFVKFVPEWVCK